MPLVVTGLPVMVKSPVLSRRATEVTVPVPLGRSAATNVLKAGCAAEPVIGPAKTLLAAWVVRVKFRDPVEVTGLLIPIL